MWKDLKHQMIPGTLLMMSTDSSADEFYSGLAIIDGLLNVGLLFLIKKEQLLKLIYGSM